MPKKILVVDDSSTMRQQVAQALKEAGYVIVEAGDGVEGLQKIADDPEIAVLIVDVNMPRMNGIEMLETYKAQGGNSDKPVIMLTSEGERSLIERAKKAGARGWIVKPFKAPLLIGAVKRLVEG